MALTRLYFITMESAPAGIPEQVGIACRAGIRLIQLRMKEATDAEFLRAAFAAKQVCDAHGCSLIVNDRVEIAAAIDAAGVHVGNEDLPVSEARKIMGPGKIVGGTANTAEDIRRHFRGGADYIGLGPYRYTATKRKLSPVLGLDGFRHVLRVLKDESIEIPVFAIGGIGPEDTRALVELGIHGLAFSGSFLRAEDPNALVAEMEAIILKTKKIDYVENSR